MSWTLASLAVGRLDHQDIRVNVQVISGDGERFSF